MPYFFPLLGVLIFLGISTQTLAQTKPQLSEEMPLELERSARVQTSYVATDSVRVKYRGGEDIAPILRQIIQEIQKNGERTFIDLSGFRGVNRVIEIPPGVWRVGSDFLDGLTEPRKGIIIRGYNAHLVYDYGRDNVVAHQTGDNLVHPYFEGITFTAARSGYTWLQMRGRGSARRLQTTDCSWYHFQTAVELGGSGNTDIASLIRPTFYQDPKRCDERGGLLVVDNDQSIGHTILHPDHAGTSPLIRLKRGGLINVYGGSVILYGRTYLNGQRDTRVALVEVEPGAGGGQNGRIDLYGCKPELHGSAFLTRIDDANVYVKWSNAKLQVLKDDTHLQAGMQHHVRAEITHRGNLKFSDCEFGDWNIRLVSVNDPASRRYTHLTANKAGVVFDGCLLPRDLSAMIVQEWVGTPHIAGYGSIYSNSTHPPTETTEGNYGVRARMGTTLAQHRDGVQVLPAGYNNPLPGAVPPYRWAAGGEYGLPAVATKIELPGGQFLERVRLVKQGGAATGTTNRWTLSDAQSETLLEATTESRTGSIYTEVPVGRVLGNARIAETVSIQTRRLGHTRIRENSFYARYAGREYVGVRLEGDTHAIALTSDLSQHLGTYNARTGALQLSKVRGGEVAVRYISDEDAYLWIEGTAQGHGVVEFFLM